LVNVEHNVREIGGGLQGKQRKKGVDYPVEKVLVVDHWIGLFPPQTGVLEKNETQVGEKENIDQIEQKKLLGVPNDFEVVSN
jgi:hypothetical protein